MVGEEGLIITNWHVVVNNPKLHVIIKPNGNIEPDESDLYAIKNFGV